MLEKPRAVSIRADRKYIKVLREIAERRGVPIADVVREALDAHLREEIFDLAPRVANLEPETEQTERQEVNNAS